MRAQAAEKALELETARRVEAEAESNRIRDSISASERACAVTGARLVAQLQYQLERERQLRLKAEAARAQPDAAPDLLLGIVGGDSHRDLLRVRHRGA